jgi:LysR family glycine cleavage system transcriptional activator
MIFVTAIYAGSGTHCRRYFLKLKLAGFMSDLRKLIPSAHSLLVFEAASRQQSFKAAADEMHVTQPSISQTIRAMEDHLGLRLFERQNRGVRLTRAGAGLMAELAPALRQIENALRDIKARESQTITVAASTSASAQWLLPITAQFQRHSPGVSVRILATDRNIEPGNEVDLAILRGPKNWTRRNCWHLSD